MWGTSRPTREMPHRANQRRAQRAQSLRDSAGIVRSDVPCARCLLTRAGRYQGARHESSRLYRIVTNRLLPAWAGSIP